MISIDGKKKRNGILRIIDTRDEKTQQTTLRLFSSECSSYGYQP